MITSGSDMTSSYGGGNSILASVPVVDNSDPISLQLNVARINQQMMLPASVKSRILGDIISSTTPSNSNTPTTSKPITILNGSSCSFLFTVADTSNRAIVAIPEPAIYIGTVDSNNQWPNNTYNMTNLQVCVFNDPVLSNGNNIVTRVEVGNITGTDLTVIATCSWRMITQPSTVFTKATVTSSVAATSP